MSKGVRQSSRREVFVERRQRGRSRCQERQTYHNARQVRAVLHITKRINPPTPHWERQP